MIISFDIVILAEIDEFSEKFLILILLAKDFRTSVAKNFLKFDESVLAKKSITITKDIVRELVNAKLLSITAVTLFIATTTAYAVTQTEMNFLNQLFLWEVLNCLSAKSRTFLSILSMWNAFEKLISKIRSRRKFLNILINTFLSLRTITTKIKTLIMWAYIKIFRSLFDLKRKFFVIEKLKWLIDTVIFVWNETIIVFRKWIERWTTLFVERVFKVIMTSMLSTKANLLTTSTKITSNFSMLLSKNMLILKLSIKWIFRRIIDVTILLFFKSKR